ncbi:MAG: hypothetical protein FJ296_04950, partial [Planctomycetes bacterium]|nr:hypothetical protein [Planctomycetota bacterium]
MLAPLLALLLALPLQENAPAEPAPPDPERVKEAVSALELAHKSGEPATMLAALELARDVAAPEVVDGVAKALKHKQADVRLAATEVLRHCKHADAPAALERHITREKKALKDDHEVLALLLRALAQHGLEKSIETLSDDVWSAPDHRVIRARFLGLANIRSDKALKAVMGLTTQAGKHKVQPYMEDVRTSLSVLTGEDEGESLDAWWAWWNDAGKSFHVAPKLPDKLPRAVETRWKAFWKEPFPGGE